MSMMGANGGLSNGKLALATATENDVSQGKTFYAGDKNIRTGTLAERGQYQYSGGVAWTGSYLALNNIPEGIYRKNGADWAPEIRFDQAQAIKSLGIQIYEGTSITASRAGWYCVISSATRTKSDYNPDPTYSTNGSNVRVVTDVSTGNSSGGHGAICVVAYLQPGQYLNIGYSNGWGTYSNSWVIYMS